MVNLLIVAPAAPLRTSLRFLLEADDYTVTAVASIAEASLLQGQFACTVLDHHAAMQRDEDPDVEFVKKHAPVVLLANEPTHSLAPLSFRTLSKPLLGAALSQAVRDAVGRGSS